MENRLIKALAVVAALGLPMVVTSAAYASWTACNGYQCYRCYHSGYYPYTRCYVIRSYGYGYNNNYYGYYPYSIIRLDFMDITDMAVIITTIIITIITGIIAMDITMAIMAMDITMAITDMVTMEILMAAITVAMGILMVIMAAMAMERRVAAI